jgi:hypothetical protein
MGISMGRSRGCKEKIRYETESVRQKCFENQILHLVRSEFGVCQAESVSVVKGSIRYIARTRADCRGLFDVRLPVLYGRHLQRKIYASRGPCVDAVLSVVAEDDLDLYLEFGMRAVQVCRIVRLVEQADCAGGTLHLGLLSSLVHLTSRTITSRLKPLWQRGLSLPLLGIAESIRGGSSRLSLVLSGHFAQRSVQQVRGELFLSATAYGQLLETASFVAQGYLDGHSAEELTASFDLALRLSRV